MGTKFVAVTAVAGAIVLAAFTPNLGTGPGLPPPAVPPAVTSTATTPRPVPSAGPGAIPAGKLHAHLHLPHVRVHGLHVARKVRFWRHPIRFWR